MNEVQTMKTNLPVPVPLRDRVIASAIADRRTYKAQMIELVEEALDARERKGARK